MKFEKYQVKRRDGDWWVVDSAGAPVNGPFSVLDLAEGDRDWLLMDQRRRARLAKREAA
jgi:hypothetical protein